MDSYEVIQRELVTFIRGVHHASVAIRVPDAPTLERPAFGLMMWVREAGELRLSALADQVQVDVSTASRQVAALEANGWMTRERDTEDRRAWRVRLTEEGERVLVANKRARHEALRAALADWTEDERQTFGRLLAQLNHWYAGLRSKAAAGHPVQPGLAADAARTTGTTVKEMP
jgi:DNA-binding MarR family transcriptional regulator